MLYFELVEEPIFLVALHVTVVLLWFFFRLKDDWLVTDLFIYSWRSIHITLAINFHLLSCIASYLVFCTIHFILILVGVFFSKSVTIMTKVMFLQHYNKHYLKACTWYWLLSNILKKLTCIWEVCFQQYIAIGWWWCLMTLILQCRYIFIRHYIISGKLGHLLKSAV